MKINEKIVERRKALKLTQRELAEKINVSDKTISKWETGSTYPPVDMIPVLAKVLNIEIEAFFEKTPTDEVTREEKYDYSKIGNFKSKVVIAIVVWIFGIFLSFYGNYMIVNDDKRFGIALLLLGVIAVLSSITLFVISLINYNNFYKDKYYIFEYEKASAYWILIYYIFIVSVVIVRLYLYHIFLTPLMFFSLINVVIILLIFKNFHFKLKTNTITKLLVIILLIILLSYFLLTIPGGPWPYIISKNLLFPSIVLGFIIGFRVEYIGNK